MYPFGYARARAIRLLQPNASFGWCQMICIACRRSTMTASPASAAPGGPSSCRSLTSYGFARVRCDAWTHEDLPAFSCTCRDFCPSGPPQAPDDLGPVARHHTPRAGTAPAGGTHHPQAAARVLCVPPPAGRDRPGRRPHRSRPPRPAAGGRRPYDGAAPAALRGRPPRVSLLPRRHAPRRVHHVGVGDRPDPHPPPDPRGDAPTHRCLRGRRRGRGPGTILNPPRLKLLSPVIPAGPRLVFDNAVQSNRLASERVVDNQGYPVTSDARVHFAHRR